MKNKEQLSKEELNKLKKREYYQNNREKILARQSDYNKKTKKIKDTSKKYHFTYQTKNLINDKTYIGVHSTNNLKDGYIGSGKALLNAVNKYGKDNFKIIIMNFFDSSAEAFKEESFLVNEEWVKNRNNYNMSIGGFGGNLGEKVNKKRGESIKGRKLSEETKNKLSNLAKGRKASDETKIKMSASQKGRKHSEETKEKIRQLNLGKISPQKTINAISKANFGENNIKFKNKTSGLPLYICNHNSKENPFIVRYKGIRVGVYPTLELAIKGKENFLNKL